MVHCIGITLAFHAEETVSNVLYTVFSLPASFQAIAIDLQPRSSGFNLHSDLLSPDPGHFPQAGSLQAEVMIDAGCQLFSPAKIQKSTFHPWHFPGGNPRPIRSDVPIRIHPGGVVQYAAATVQIKISMAGDIDGCFPVRNGPVFDA